MYPSLDGPRGKPWLPRPSRTSDMVVNACHAIVAATSRHQLTEGVAVALAGELGDCVIVDASPDGEMTRSVAGPGPELAARLSRLKPAECPLTVTTTRRATPIVYARAEDRTLLGHLPDGRTAADALHVTSVAAAPMTTGREALGAIIIARGGNTGAGAYITFNELRLLAEIAELAGAALAAWHRRGQGGGAG